jgi:hypothetical protein
MKRLALALAALALLAGACGSGRESAQQILADTSANLGKIKSGDLAMELTFSAKGGKQAGFSLEGPFALHAGRLPDAQLDYTQNAGGRTATQTFISTGDKAYVRIRGTTYELPEATANEVRSTVGTTGGLQVIDLSSWMRDPTLHDGGEVGGADTDRIDAKLNVPAAVSGLMAIASQFGGTTGPGALSGASAEQVERAVHNATISVWTGKDDRLLRKVEMTLELSPAASEQIKSVIGAGAHFVLAISNPNEKVSVQRPANAKPFPTA